eukprot:3611027-Pyramimonas_sp.AAC.1
MQSCHEPIHDGRRAVERLVDSVNDVNQAVERQQTPTLVAPPMSQESLGQIVAPSPVYSN